MAEISILEKRLLSLKNKDDIIKMANELYPLDDLGFWNGHGQDLFIAVLLDLNKLDNYSLFDFINIVKDTECLKRFNIKDSDCTFICYLVLSPFLHLTIGRSNTNE